MANARCVIQISASDSMPPLRREKDNCFPLRHQAPSFVIDVLFSQRLRDDLEEFSPFSQATLQVDGLRGAEAVGAEEMDEPGIVPVDQGVDLLDAELPQVVDILR